MNFGKYNSISELYVEDRYRKRFELGMMGTGFLQGLFILNLLSHLELNIYLGIGSIIFFLGSVGMFLMGIYTTKDHKLIHSLSAKSYFFLTSIGGGIITAVIPISPILKLIILISLLFWLVNSIIHRDAWDRLYIMEMTHVFLSYIWILLIGFGVLLLS